MNYRYKGELGLITNVNATVERSIFERGTFP
jgi:hypothetical protein